MADPTDPQRYFAVIASNGTGNGGVYSTPDAGLTWDRVSDNHVDPRGLNHVLDQNSNNARLAVSPTGRLFVVVGLVVGPAGQAAMLAYTDDAGQSWQTMDLPSFLVGESAAQGGPLPVSSIARTAGNARIVVDCGTNHLLGDKDHVRLAGVDPFGANGESLNGDWRIEIVSPTQIALLDRFTGQEGTGETDGDTDTNVSGTATWTGWAGGNQGGQTGFGHLAITVDPGNDDCLYLAGDAGPGFVARGNVGGTPGSVPSQQWTSVIDGQTASGTRPHPDVRDLLVDGSGNLLAATDGGIFLRTSPTNSNGDWSGIPGNMVNGEMLSIAIDPVSNTLLGGLQDNGSPGQTNPMLVGPQPWGLLWGNDGRGVAAVDAGTTHPDTGLPPSHRYTTDQFETSFVRHDCDSNLACVQYSYPNPADPSNPIMLPYKTLELQVAGSNPAQFVKDVDDIGWLQTLVINPLDPDRLLLGAAQQGIWESMDQGATASLVPGSPSAAKDIVAGAGTGAGANPEALWAVSDTGVYSRFAAGATMTKHTNFNEPSALAVTMSPTDPQVAYVTTDTNVYRTPDRGGTWENVTGDLTETTLRIAGVEFNGPPTELRDIVYVESPQGDRVVVAAARGTTGVYMMAVDDPKPGTWVRIGNDLPNVSVYELDYDPSADALAVATHGRGAWSIDSISTLNRAPKTHCDHFSKSADASCSATALASSFDTGSTDPEGDSLDVRIYDPQNGNPADVMETGARAHPVTLYVEDANGSAALCGPVDFIIEDDTPPELDVPPDVQVALCAASETVNVGQATMDDNCATGAPTGEVVTKNGSPLSPPLPVVSGQIELGPGQYEIEWTADDGANPPVTGTQNVTVGGAIVAYDTYDVRDRAQVVDTSSVPSAVFNAGSGATIIGGDGAQVGPVFAGGDVTTYSGGFVEGDITAVGSIQVWGTHNGNEVFVSAVNFPSAPALPAFPPANNIDHWIDPGADLALAPGRYGSVGVNGNPDPSFTAILRLQAGDYFFDNLYLNADGLVVLAEAGTRIFVSGQLSFHTPVLTNTTSSELAPIVLGLTGPGDAALYAPFVGQVIAPERKLIMGTDSGTQNGMTFTGSFYAGSIDLQPDSNLVCDASAGGSEPLTCSNGVVDSGETDVDCGGPVCQACGDGQGCAVGTDCQSKVCTSNLCQVPSCSDGVQNGSETGQDCGGTCSACPVSCNPATYPAENMYHSTGNAWWQGGWNIYDNGYISTTHDFSAGPSTITVTALGEEALGLPHMVVQVDGVVVQPAAGYQVSSGGFNPYEFSFTAAGGVQEIRVIYDNDYYDGFNDRNLIVQSVDVDCP